MPQMKVGNFSLHSTTLLTTFPPNLLPLRGVPSFYSTTILFPGSVPLQCLTFLIH